MLKVIVSIELKTSLGVSSKKDNSMCMMPSAASGITLVLVMYLPKEQSIIALLRDLTSLAPDPINFISSSEETQFLNSSK